jgi:hypothetical protein
MKKECRVAQGLALRSSPGGLKCYMLRWRLLECSGVKVEQPLRLRSICALPCGARCGTQGMEEGKLWLRHSLSLAQQCGHGSGTEVHCLLLQVTAEGSQDLGSKVHLCLHLQIHREQALETMARRLLSAGHQRADLAQDLGKRALLTGRRQCYLNRQVFRRPLWRNPLKALRTAEAEMRSHRTRRHQWEKVFTNQKL